MIRYVGFLLLIVVIFSMTMIAYAQVCPEGVCPGTATPAKTLVTPTEIIVTTEVVVTTEVSTSTPQPSVTATIVQQTLPPPESPTPTMWQYPTRTKESKTKPKNEEGGFVLPSGGGVPAFQATEDARIEDAVPIQCLGGGFLLLIGALSFRLTKLFF